MNKILKKSVGVLVAAALLVSLFYGFIVLNVSAVSESYDKVFFTDDFTGLKATGSEGTVVSADYFPIQPKSTAAKMTLENAEDAEGVTKQNLKLWSMAGSTDNDGDVIAEMSNYYVNWQKNCQVELSFTCAVSEDAYVRLIVWDGIGGMLGVCSWNSDGATSVSSDKNGLILEKTDLENGWIFIKLGISVASDQDPYLAFTVRQGKDGLSSVQDGSAWIMYDEITLIAKDLVRESRNYKKVFSENFDEVADSRDPLFETAFVPADDTLRSSRAIYNTGEEVRAINSASEESKSALLELSEEKLLRQEWTTVFKFGINFENTKLTRGYYKFVFDERNSGVYTYNIVLKTLNNLNYAYALLDPNTMSDNRDSGQGTRMDSEIVALQDTQTGQVYHRITLYFVVTEDSYLDLTIRQYYADGSRTAQTCTWAVFDNFELYRADAAEQLTASYEDYRTEHYASLQDVSQSIWVHGSGASNTVIADGLLQITSNGTEQSVLSLKEYLDPADGTLYKFYLQGKFDSTVSALVFSLYDEAGLLLRQVEFDLLKTSVTSTDALDSYRSTIYLDTMYSVFTMTTEFEIDDLSKIEVSLKSAEGAKAQLIQTAVLRAAENSVPEDKYETPSGENAEYIQTGGVLHYNSGEWNILWVVIPAVALVLAAGAVVAVLLIIKRRQK